MGQYRKKPVVIEAFLWTDGPDQIEDPTWIVDAIKAGEVWFSAPGSDHCQMFINTLEGVHQANIGDYIIKGVKGELYPCKPEIFKMTYEKEA
jgi:hypothetical protein